MSESSQEKSKRIFIKNLNSYSWEYKLNLYFSRHEFGKDIFKYISKINSSIRTKNPSNSFIYRVCLNRAKKAAFEDYGECEVETHLEYVIAPMITYFCNRKPILPDLKRIKTIDICDYKFTEYRQDEEAITNYIETIRKQKPHDLMKYLNGRGQRYGYINKKLLTDIQKTKILFPSSSNPSHL